MASLTVRKLDDAIRRRTAAARGRNGRSVKDEVRENLREA